MILDVIRSYNLQSVLYVASLTVSRKIMSIIWLTVLAMKVQTIVHHGVKKYVFSNKHDRF